MNVDWYARAQGIRQMGPYRTEVEAWAAIMTRDGTPAPGGTVWCVPATARAAETTRLPERVNKGEGPDDGAPF